MDPYFENRLVTLLCCSKCFDENCDFSFHDPNSSINYIVHDIDCGSFESNFCFIVNFLSFGSY